MGTFHVSEISCSLFSWKPSNWKFSRLKMITAYKSISFVFYIGHHMYFLSVILSPRIIFSLHLTTQSAPNHHNRHHQMITYLLVLHLNNASSNVFVYGRPIKSVSFGYFRRRYGDLHYHILKVIHFQSNRIFPQRNPTPFKLSLISTVCHQVDSIYWNLTSTKSVSTLFHKDIQPVTSMFSSRYFRWSSQR